MRKTVLVPVQKLLCDAHIARDGSEVEATATLSLGAYTWDLCPEHDVTFGRYLIDALGVPAEAEASEAGPVADEPQHDQQHDGRDQDDAAESGHDEPLHQPSVMITGEVPGYSWDEAREALRNVGFRVAGRADETTVLIICGEGAERNATKLRDARERGIPCMDATQPGRFETAIGTGELVGGDPLPDPVKAAPAGVSDRERNRMVRDWARLNGHVVPDRGRIPMTIRYAYELAHQSEAVAA
ncbi:hypothetical protein CTZ27_18945 [Streptomyces griseocarneus]|nr:hypothetical protein CTZ27_18945 [Streptomyces griseocarneus]